MLLTLGTHLLFQEFKQWTQAFQQVLAKSLGVPGLSLGDTMPGDGRHNAVIEYSYVYMMVIDGHYGARWLEGITSNEEKNQVGEL